MSYAENEGVYLDLMDRFCEKAVSANNFQETFSDLWRRDRDEELLLGASAQEKSWFQGDSVRDDPDPALEYGKSWAEVLGKRVERARAYRSLLDSVFSACHMFIEDPTHSICPDDEYDEESLRAFVRERVNSFRSASNEVP
jgi:hypothetical protein